MTKNLKLFLLLAAITLSFYFVSSSFYPIIKQFSHIDSKLQNYQKYYNVKAKVHTVTKDEATDTYYFIVTGELNKDVKFVWEIKRQYTKLNFRRYLVRDKYYIELDVFYDVVNDKVVVFDEHFYYTWFKRDHGKFIIVNDFR